jgi:hypothetical protein
MSKFNKRQFIYPSSRHARRRGEKGEQRGTTAFGVRRSLLGAIAVGVGRELETRRQEGEITEKLKIIQRPGLELLSRSVVREQVEAGLFKRPPRHVRNLIEAQSVAFPERAEGTITDVRLWHGRILHLTLESERLSEEVDAVTVEAARCGARLADFEKYKQLRVPFGVLKSSISLAEREGLICAAYEIIDTIQQDGFEVEFGAANVYPTDYGLAA